jgi:hypothetical protein
MKKILIEPVLMVMIILGCSELPIEKETPECVVKKIKDYKHGPCKHGSKVKEFLFQEKTVYAFSPGNCGADLGGEVIDAECTHVGFLGGISGNTIINGEEFSNATFIKTIWEE